MSDRVPGFCYENWVFAFFLKVPIEPLAWRLSGNNPKPSTTQYSLLAKQVMELHAAGGLVAAHESRIVARQASKIARSLTMATATKFGRPNGPDARCRTPAALRQQAQKVGIVKQPLVSV